MDKVLEIILKHDKFPCKLSKDEGEYFSKKFEFSKNCLNNQQEVRNMEYFYTYELNGEKYVLIEEFLFMDTEEVLDVSRALGKNYYLYKKNNKE